VVVEPFLDAEAHKAVVHHLHAHRAGDEESHPGHEYPEQLRFPVQASAEEGEADGAENKAERRVVVAPLEVEDVVALVDDLMELDELVGREKGEGRRDEAPGPAPARQVSVALQEIERQCDDPDEEELGGGEPGRDRRLGVEVEKMQERHRQRNEPHTVGHDECDLDRDQRLQDSSSGRVHGRNFSFWSRT